MLKEILSKLTSGQVYKKKMPQRVGGRHIYVSPTASLGYLKFSMDDIAGMPELFDAACMFVSPGDSVWDIGANLGAFSFAAAWKAGKTGHVIALEPDVFLVNVLNKSVSLQDTNMMARVDVIPAAVSDTCGLIRLNVASKGRAANYIETAQGSTQVGKVVSMNWVCQLTLDNLLEKFPKPDFIKIDVEGAEYAVLKGGIKTISEFKPIILCEVRESLAGDVTALLRGKEYELYDLDNLAAGTMRNTAYNTLAVPLARTIEIEEIIRKFYKK